MSEGGVVLVIVLVGLGAMLGLLLRLRHKAIQDARKKQELEDRLKGITRDGKRPDG